MGVKFDEKKGRWVASFSERHPISGKVVTLRRLCKSEAEGKRVERELIREVAKRLLEKKSPGWLKVVEEYLEDGRMRGLTEHTLCDYRTGLMAYTGNIWRSHRVDEVSTQDIHGVMRGEIAGKSVGHQKNLLKFIRGVLGFAIQRGYIVVDPCPDLRFRVGDKLKGVLTEEQIKRLLDRAREAKTDWYPVWALALFTGMRNGELFALTWDNVNLDDGLISVKQSWNKYDGFKSTKSGDDRIIEIAPALKPLLMELRLQSGGSPFVLPRVNKWDRGDQAKELRFFLLGMGLPPIRFHDLRSSWCTLLLSKGIAPIKVMQAGGWKDLKTLMIYIRKSGVDIKGMSSVLDFHYAGEKRGEVVSLMEKAESRKS